MKKIIHRNAKPARKNKYKGAGSAMYVVIIVFLMTLVAAALVSWQLPKLDDSKVGSPVTIITNTPEPSKGNLQLYTFYGMTPTPSSFNGLSVFVGYADNLRPDPIFPAPWKGDPNTTFIGSGSRYDAGAIRFENITSQPIIIQSVILNFPNHNMNTQYYDLGNLWGSFTIAPGTSTIVTQTKEYNFDTSDLNIPGISCNQRADKNNNPPQVTIMLADGSKTTLYDYGHILDVGGGDSGCSNINEHRAWSAIGTIGNIGANLTLSPSSNIYPVGSNELKLTATLKDASNVLPLSNVEVRFTVLNGPNKGKTGTAITDTNGTAQFFYTSATAGVDTVTATVKNFSGGSFDSNTVTVQWAQG